MLNTQTEIKPMQLIRGYMRSDVIVSRFADIVGKGNAGAYIQSALLAVSSNDSLLSCTPQSIVGSALRAATLRLSCDPGIGEAYIVPFKTAATLIVGYKGLRAMALRTGQYRYLHVSNVWEGENALENRKTGVWEVTGEKKGDLVIGRMAFFELYGRNGNPGFSKELYMTTEQIHAHAKRFSKSYNFENSYWKKYKPGEEHNQMEIKTPFRLLITRWGYLDPQDRQNANLKADAETDEVIEAETKDIPSPEEVGVTAPEKRATEILEAELTGDWEDAFKKIIKRLAFDQTAADATLKECGNYQTAVQKLAEANKELLS